MTATILRPKPCPFCGSDNVDTREGSTFRWMLAECGECGATGPEIRVQTLGDGTPDAWRYNAQRDALIEWDKRAARPGEKT